MNKKMKELKSKIDEKLESIKNMDPESDGEAMANALDEVAVMQKAFDLEQRRVDAEKAHVGAAADVKSHEGENAVSGFTILAKALRGQSLTEAEAKAIQPKDEVVKALITGVNATQGEANLIPEDVDATIRELRRSYVSAVELAEEITTEALTGSFTFEANAPAGLVNFDDGDAVPNGTDPKFVNSKFSITLFGIIIPVSNVLTVTEKAGLVAYLNRWFVKNAVITENKKIFEELAADKEAVALSGLDGLRKSLNKDLDPSCLTGAVIATNQSGFAAMDDEKDENGRGLLQPDPADPTRKLYNGLPIKVYPDAQLPNIDETHAPVFYGNTKAGVYFIRLKYTFFDASAHAGFGKNQTHLRVIEGIDCIGADKDAYCYGSLDLIAAQAAG